MWLAFFVLGVIVLSIVGLAFGTLWIAVPAILLLAVGLVFHMTVLRAGSDSTGKVERGGETASQRERAEDTPGEHGEESTGYAHAGQPHMTPEQDRPAS